MSVLPFLEGFALIHIERPEAIMRFVITLVITLATTSTLAAEPTTDPVAAAEATFRARERAATEQLRTELLKTIELEAAAQTAASSSCTEAKMSYIDASLALDRTNGALAHVPATAMDAQALVDYRKSLEGIKADAEAQIASAKAKASASGAELEKAKTKLTEARAALDKLNRMDDEALDAALSSGIGGIGGLGELGSRQMTIPLGYRQPAVVTLPKEFASCGFKTLEVNVATN